MCRGVVRKELGQEGQEVFTQNPEKSQGGVLSRVKRGHLMADFSAFWLTNARVQSHVLNSFLWFYSQEEKVQCELCQKNENSVLTHTCLCFTAAGKMLIPAEVSHVRWGSAGCAFSSTLRRPVQTVSVSVWSVEEKGWLLPSPAEENSALEKPKSHKCKRYGWTKAEGFSEAAH